ncbi:Hypothetical predicted protein [Lynx pardinus]|uniref:Uncharacterized protein n=1 Tax=Lynx pardinus TaxID=191816 RepID=A0A485P6Z7_LYNPA|nr:Hypothetical predicted protein [Lynx pardinus]
MGVSGDEWQKCHKTGGKRKPHHRKQSASSSQLVSTEPLVKILQGAGGRHTLPTAVWVPPALPLGHKKGAKLTPKEEEISSKKR